MQTMHPSIMLGPYVWAQDRLPGDEFTLRLANLRDGMAYNGWPAMLVYGDAREHAALAYVSNFIPRMRWGMALLPRSGDARLICSMSPRDLPAMRAMTWIADVRSGWGEWDQSFAPWFERIKSDAIAEVGTIGFDLMSPVLRDSVQHSLGAHFALRRAEERLAVPPRRKRPREITLVRGSCKVLAAAAEEFVAAWRARGEPETAALEAERIARSLAAQDVRTLISLDGGRTLVPYQGRFKRISDRLVGYLAVKVAGYWADVFVTSDEQDNTALRQVVCALGLLIDSARPGARAGDLQAAAMDALAPFALHPVLCGCVGHAIGLSLDEKPELRAAAEETLVEDGVYSLQVGVADGRAGNALLSAMIRVTAAGAEVLMRSPL